MNNQTNRPPILSRIINSSQTETENKLEEKDFPSLNSKKKRKKKNTDYSKIVPQNNNESQSNQNEIYEPTEPTKDEFEFFFSSLFD